MNLLLAVSEAAPLAKAGGLGDAVSALAKALAGDHGIRTTIILPCYRDLAAEHRQAFREIHSFVVELGWRRQPCRLLAGEVDGQSFLLIDNPYYFGRGGIYGYDDEAERYVFFCLAVVAALPLLGEWPDIVHCHDWQSALIPYLLKTREEQGGLPAPIRTVFTIHNMLYQGRLPLNLMADLLGVDVETLTSETLELYGEACCLKAGLLYADRLTTVSESYLEEIQTAEHGGQLDGVIRSRRADISAWANGIDTVVYDPMTDPALVMPYRNALAKKARNKTALQMRLGLPETADVPLVGIVSRLTWQKGLELVGEALDELAAIPLQLVVLGAGEPEEEARVRAWADRYPEQVAVTIGFDEALARQIYAASDLYLMPSRYEPCGLSQQIAMQYRAVPIVHATGGLRDTVRPFDAATGQGEGFVFAPHTPEAMLAAIRAAVSVYRDPERWKRLAAAAAKRDLSWRRPASRYVSLYRELLDERKEKI